MENNNYTLDDLRKRLILPEEDLELMKVGKPPRLSTLKLEIEMPKHVKDLCLETMEKHGIDHLFQWILFSLITTGVYDDCIDYRIIHILKKQWQVEEARPIGKQQL